MKLPVYHFEGHIEVEKGQGFYRGYLHFPFNVPEGVGAIHLSLRYSPVRVGELDNLITPGLYDPAGFRGEAHRHPANEDLAVGVDRASPGFVAGKIGAGVWVAQLTVHTVVEDATPCHYTLDISLEAGRPGAGVATYYPPAPARLNDRPGWYGGELHSHTFHSDGALPPAELVAQARQQGLDFLAITDHNTNAALGEIDPASLGPMLLIPGMELTTLYGHALVLGTRQWIDWRTGYQGRTIDQAASEAHAAGALFIMAHPQAVGSPICTGCHWEFSHFDLDLADAFEVWNGPWPDPYDQNIKGLHAWRELQATGRRLPATAGTDFHSLGNWNSASPRVWVYARELSVAAVLDGIRQGRVILSAGPKLAFQVLPDGAGTPGEVGDIVVAPSQRATLSVSWDRVPQGNSLHLRNAEGLLLSTSLPASGSLQQLIQIHRQERVWVELYGENGFLIAMTNPIFIQPG